MVSSLLEIGFKSLDRLASSATRRRKSTARRHPLDAYPSLQTLLHEAERSGSLAAERRRLIARRWSA